MGRFWAFCFSFANKHKHRILFRIIFQKVQSYMDASFFCYFESYIPIQMLTTQFCIYHPTVGAHARF